MKLGKALALLVALQATVLTTEFTVSLSLISVALAVLIMLRGTQALACGSSAHVPCRSTSILGPWMIQIRVCPHRV